MEAFFFASMSVKKCATSIGLVVLYNGGDKRNLLALLSISIK